jgi:hypothetical protein
MAREPRDGLRIDIMPALAGPDTANKMTMTQLEPEFVDYLRVRGIPFYPI